MKQYFLIQTANHYYLSLVRQVVPIFTWHLNITTIFTFQDRDEIMRQLACSISNDDFDEKSSKPPQPTEKENSFGTRTTKSWVWTSHTVDTEYGTPTRHRRETDDTSIPLSTESTKDFPTSEGTSEVVTTSKPLALTTKGHQALKTTSSMHDVTLESSVAATSENFDKTDTTTTESTTGVTGNKLKEQPETLGTSTAPAEYKNGELQQEYPSAINQGQLFSIIENGKEKRSANLYVFLNFILKHIMYLLSIGIMNENRSKLLLLT